MANLFAKVSISGTQKCQLWYVRPYRVRRTKEQNNTSHQKLSAEGALSTTDAIDSGSMKMNRPQSTIHTVEAEAMVD